MNNEQFKNKYIANLLRNLAAALLLKNENKPGIRFKIIAYEKAADTVEHLTREIKDIWEDGKLDDLPGFGSSITSNMDEYFRTGESKHFNELLRDIPSSVFVLMQVPSIGPKKAYKLVNHLKLMNDETVLADLVVAAEKNKIAGLETFGEKSQQDILEAVQRFMKNEQTVQRMPLPFASSLAEEVMSYLKQLQTVRHADALGSLRRMVSTIGDVDIAVEAPIDATNDILKHFVKFPGTVHVDNMGDRKASIFVAGNRRVDLRVQTKENYGSMLQYFTGSKAHNIKLREYALKKGYSLSEYGIKEVKNNDSSSRLSDSGRASLARMTDNEKQKILEFEKEEGFYNFLGLQYVPPEIREGTNEIELALKNKLPDLVAIEDIKGDFHIHSSYDLQPSHDMGAHSYEQLMDEAMKLGYRYIGFADHNPKSSLSENEIVSIMKQRKEYIDETFSKKKVKIPYFIGLEVDIQPSGELALPEKAIEYVDYLVVSIHSSFRMPSDEMTARVLKGLSYPKVKLFGHPTGRIINQREGIDLKWDSIFQYVKEKNIALEINAATPRLDLPDDLVREGHKYGVRYIIDTDAHAVDALPMMVYGVSVARRGWCEKSDMINTGSYEEVREWITLNY